MKIGNRNNFIAALLLTFATIPTFAQQRAALEASASVASPTDCASAEFLDQLRARHRCSVGDPLECFQSLDPEQIFSWAVTAGSIPAAYFLEPKLNQLFRLDSALASVKTEIAEMQEIRRKFEAENSLLKAKRDKRISKGSARGLDSPEIKAKNQAVWEEFLEEKRKLSHDFAAKMEKIQDSALSKIHNLNGEEQEAVKKILAASRSAIDMRRSIIDIDDEVNALKAQESKLHGVKMASHGAIPTVETELKEVQAKLKDLQARRADVKKQMNTFFEAAKRNAEKIFTGVLNPAT